MKTEKSRDQWTQILLQIHMTHIFSNLIITLIIDQSISLHWNKKHSQLLNSKWLCKASISKINCKVSTTWEWTQALQTLQCHNLQNHRSITLKANKLTSGTNLVSNSKCLHPRKKVKTNKLCKVIITSK